jgi:hypothetical protein
VTRKLAAIGMRQYFEAFQASVDVFDCNSTAWNIAVGFFFRLRQRLLIAFFRTFCVFAKFLYTGKTAICKKTRVLREN